MSDRRLLILTPQLPYPPIQGTSLRNFHIIKGLAQHNRVTLLSFVEPGQVAEQAEQGPLGTLCEQIVTVPAPERTRRDRIQTLISGSEPDMAQRLASQAFKRKLGRLLRSFAFDVVHVEGIELAFTMPMIRVVSPDSLILFDDHNAETELQRRAFLTDIKQVRRLPAALYSRVQTGRLSRYEAWACRTADIVTAVSETDANLLQKLSDRPVHAIPNCIDVEQYRAARRRPPFDYDMVITGKMDYRPNIDAVLWFGRDIWPLIRRSRPAATWAIVGQKPHERLAPLRSMPGVTVTGRVDEIQPYLEGGKVYVMPFRIGSGTRLKLIEAMAAGKAIVSTSMGAEGFPVTDGEQLLIADEPEAFASAVRHLLQAHDERQRLGRNAAEFSDAYDWRRVIPQFERLYVAAQTS